MRIYLLPLSTRRTLLYAHRVHIPTTDTNQNIADKIVGFAAKKWAEYEKKESGWQRKLVDYGNHAFRRIPYEEWGLKSIPPLSKRRRAEELGGQDDVELVFPGATIPAHRAQSILKTLATERESLHRKRLMLSFVAMPFTAPVAILPVIPNIPFFYLAYRAWSHWRAISGGKHVQWLLENKLIKDKPSETLDHLYIKDGPTISDSLDVKEQILLTQRQVRNFSDTLNIPELEVELERAIWQVEQALQKGEEAAKVHVPSPSEKSKDDGKEKDVPEVGEKEKKE
ncbi:unnamed protein product [Clonostachys rhizophaga]|uniref:Mitochondrial K+-H+ exchange-related-domain-containing protein n=1 Tax=Clonostachys rhizophaga TaxID=160324 RepID=A0A9N9V3G1_9HYPO|nr:unnamed protein product [Clonostachys rhizophaga]